MAFTRTGDLIASQPREGKVVLLKRDANGDGKHDGEMILLENLHRPHGLALYKDYLYVAESNAIGRVPFNDQRGKLEGDYEIMVSDLPDNGNHWSKSILIRDDTLYVSIGSSCNVCEEDDKRRATIMAFDIDGGNGRVFASGLRNSVGMDIAPWSGAIYATDNGRDLLGDDYPPCELNEIDENAFYGWPYINGFGNLDPDLGAGKEQLLATASSPAFGFRAHNAPLGIEFLDTATVPTSYQRSALVALHGSWNRSEPDGYKVVSLHWGEDGKIVSKDFLTGFEKHGDTIGRPVDIDEGEDGCLYVSDDYTGTIYRICYGKQKTAAIDPSPEILEEDSFLDSLSAIERQQASERGQALYRENNCDECHELNGAGNETGKALAALDERYTSQRLADYFLTPNPPMPQYSLSDSARLDLAIYLMAPGE